MTPDKDNMRINVFADADFAGLYTTEDRMDPVSIKSRTGVLLTFGNVPILWSSKLQSEIALSTLEAEYIVLSQGMRDLISARRMMAELGERMNYKIDKAFHISKVWKDNTSTQNLANSKGSLMTSCTKHIGIRYYWFRSMIGPQIEILRIDIQQQRADIFTKGLTRYNFEQIRKRVMGW